MDDQKRFQKLIEADYKAIKVSTYEENYALDIIRRTAKELDRQMWVWSVAKGVYDGLSLDSASISDTEKPAVGIHNLKQTQPPVICVTLDLAEHLNAGQPRRVLRDLINYFQNVPNTLVMIDAVAQLPEVIRAYTTPFEISYPDSEEIKDIVSKTLTGIHRKNPIKVDISKKGLQAIVRNLRGLTRRQARRIIADTVVDDLRFDDEDINRVIAGKRRMLSQDGLLEYIKTPLTLDAIGGMDNLKEWLRVRKNAFSPKARSFGISAPKGVLMLGIQGAGKSLCAKAVATGFQQPLLRLDPSSLYGSYIGQSEHNLRRALRQTEMMAPVVLWVDEIEKAFASAASRSTDGGLSQRMFGTLLTWMQERDDPVFLVATANDIQALPPELLRKGRFDEIFFVSFPKQESRKKIFSIHLEKRKQNPADFDIEKLARNSDSYTGAEIEQAILSALHKAYQGSSSLTTEDVLDALESSPPLSVTMSEKVETLLNWAKGRCVPAE